MDILIWIFNVWSLHRNHIRSFEVFLHKRMRSILGIRMYQVKEYHITNEMVRKKLYNITTIYKNIGKWHITYLRKIPNKHNHPPYQLLLSWRNNKIKPIAFLKKNKNTLFENISIITPEVDNQGLICTRVYHTIDNKTCNGLVYNIRQCPSHPPYRTTPQLSRPNPYPPIATPKIRLKKIQIGMTLTPPPRDLSNNPHHCL